MNKQCGTCKWRVRFNSDVIDGERIAKCRNSKANAVFATSSDEGQDCQAYEERKE